MKRIITALLLLALLVPSVYAVQTVNDQQGEVVTIDNDVNEDLFISGNKVIINGNVNGDLFAAAGEVNINGKVDGDAYVAAGTVTVNGNITGELIVGAGQVTVSGNTEKILAGCGDLAIKGNTKKVVAASGNVRIYSTSIIEEYAYIAAGTFDNQGTINGELVLTAEQLINKGTVGSFDYKETTTSKDFSEGMKAIATIFSILAAIGMLVLGILLIRFFPKLFFTVEKEVETDTIVRTIIGFLLIIATIIAIVVLAVTVIGLPIATILGMLLLIALMLSGMFVSYSAGKFVTKRLNINTGEMGMFIIGFVIIAILGLIPILGGLVSLVVTSLGFGAIYYALKNNWNLITAKN